MLSPSGWRVVVVPPVREEVRRTWKDRLFGTPWNPLRKFNVRLEETLKDGKVIAREELKEIYCNAKTAHTINAALERERLYL